MKVAVLLLAAASAALAQDFEGQPDCAVRPIPPHINTHTLSLVP